MWYKIYVWYCPVCLKETRTKERMSGVRPEIPYEFHEDYDYCEG